MSVSEERTLVPTVVEEYSYVYNGSSLVRLDIKTTTTQNGTTTTTTSSQNFYYENSSTPMAVDWNGSLFYYTTNLQSDVTGLTASDGTSVVQYTYDAWGNILTTTGSKAETLGKENPITYRGYVYDAESHLFYLQSRYYSPEMGRFINADNYPSTGQGLLGNNMFAYCANNPVSRADDGGEFWNVVIGAVAGAALSAASELVSQLINHAVTGADINWGDIATSAAGGAVYGAVMAATGSNLAASVASTATTSVIDGIRNGDSAGEILADTAKNTLVTAVTCTAPKIVNKSLSGKYAKTNTVQKMIKKMTSSPHKGKYMKGNNYLADSLSYSVKRSRNRVLLDTGVLVGKHLIS